MGGERGSNWEGVEGDVDFDVGHSDLTGMLITSEMGGWWCVWVGGGWGWSGVGHADVDVGSW